MDLLDALVNDRGRVAAAEVLGVNYRTMMACYDSRRVSRRMRKALEEFRDAGTGTEASETEVDGDGAADEVETLRQRVAELEEEARGLRGLVETQAGQLEELGRRVAHLVREAQQRGESEPVAGDDQPSVWRPPRRRPRVARRRGGHVGGAARRGPMPSARRRRTGGRVAGSCEHAETKRQAAGSIGPGPGRAGGNWRRSCCGTFT